MDCPRRGVAETVFGGEGAAAELRSDMGVGIGRLMGLALHRWFSTDDEFESGGRLLDETLSDCGGWSGVHFDRTTPGEAEARRQVRGVMDKLSAHRHRWIGGGAQLEKPFERKTPWLLGVEMVKGRVDRITRDAGGDLVLHDLKVVSTPPESAARGVWRHGAQMGAYGYLTGEPVSESVVHFVSRRTGDSGEARLDADICKRQYDLSLGVASASLKKYDDDGPLSVSANPMSLSCGERNCRAWGTKFCDVWRR